MIIDRLRIENLFCYAGVNEFDLTPPDDGRAVVLFAGRNNQGKTSFLNCLKLLFLGVDHDELRSTAVENRKLARKHYVFGTEDAERTWEGMLNRGALAGRDWSKQWFRVMIEFLERGTQVRIERKWEVVSLEQRKFEEVLTVEFIVDPLNRRVLEGEEATDYLRRTIDPEFLSYFMFDGELIRQMAGSDDRERIEAMERILGLTPLSMLGSFAAEAQRKWVQEGASAAERSALDQLRSAQQRLADDVRAAEQQLGDIEFELEQLERHVQRLEGERAALKPARERFDEVRVRERLKAKQTRLEELRLQQIPAAVLAPAATLFNTALARRTLEQLARIQASASDRNGATDVLLHSLIEELPRALDRPPYSDPPLTPDQVHHYKSVLQSKLKSYLSVPKLAADQMPPDALNRARSALARAKDDDRARLTAARLLAEALDLKSEVESLMTRLDSALDAPEVDQEKRRQVEEHLQTLIERRGALKERQREASKRKKRASSEQGQMSTKIAAQEGKVQLAESARAHVGTARAAMKFVDSLSELVRTRARQRLERSINAHFQQLFTSNRQIHRIKVADHLGLTYLSEDGQIVGKGNISAGTQQLIAISFLWALKDLAESELPMVVDTPLARLDLPHQENLLQHYFPKAGRQVIVLATDSELTREKYNILKPAIYREFALLNPDGGSVHVLRDHAMYDVIEGA